MLVGLQRSQFVLIMSSSNCKDPPTLMWILLFLIQLSQLSVVLMLEHHPRAGTTPCGKLYHRPTLLPRETDYWDVFHVVVPKIRHISLFIMT